MFIDFGDCLALGNQHIGLTQLVNDRFGVVSFLRYGSDLLDWLLTSFHLDQFSDG